MIVKSIFQIKGRGIIAVVDASDIPVGVLKIGIWVHQGDKSWKIVGVETACGGSLLNDVGLVLSGTTDIPVEGELCL